MKAFIYKIKNIANSGSELIGLMRKAVKSNIVLFAIVFLLLGVGLTLLLKKDGTIYTGDTKFILKESGGNSGAGLGGVLGSIGLGTQNKENYERLIAMVQTQRLQRDILLNEIRIDDSTYILGDALIDYYELNEMLSGIGLQSFRFANYTSEEKYQDVNLKKAVRKVGDVLTGTPDMEGLIGMSYDRKTHIISIAASTIDDDLTIGILNSIYLGLQQFYDENLIQNKSKEFDVLSGKIDSLRNVVQSKETQLARFTDQYNRVILYQDKVTKSRLTVEIKMLYEVLGQLTANAALLEYSLLTTPQGFVLLDEPVKPLFSGSRALWKVIVFSVVFSLFMATMIVFLKQAFKNPEALDIFSTDHA